jgi:ABC-type nitrate/sulfonate/bicarbonate transport system permease component
MISAAVSLERRRRRVAHGVTLAFLAIWSIAGLTAPSYLLPSPWLVAERMIEFLGDPHMWVHIGVSFEHIFVSVLASIAIGGVLAILAHYVPVLRLAVHGRICPFLNSFAGTGWVLLAILWFGLNDFTVVFAIAMVLIPFAIINTRLGLESIDPDIVEMSHSFGRSSWIRFRLIVLPALTPFVFSTLRICFGVAWKAALTAELFGGDAGFGHLFNLARQDYDTPLVLVIITLMIASVYAIDRYIFEPVQAFLAAHYEFA